MDAFTLEMVHPKSEYKLQRDLFVLSESGDHDIHLVSLSIEMQICCHGDLALVSLTGAFALYLAADSSPAVCESNKSLHYVNK